MGNRLGSHDNDNVTTYILKAGETTLNEGCAAVLDLTTVQQCENAGAAGAANMVGVLLDSTLEAGKAGAFAFGGIVRCKASAAVAKGKAVMIANTSGEFIAHDGSTKERVGLSMSAAAAADEFFLVMLQIPSADIS